MRAVSAALVALVGLVACGGSPAPRAPGEERGVPPVTGGSAPGSDGDRGGEARVSEPPPLVHRPPLGPMLEEPADGAIVAVALAPDGGAALTLDAAGGLRLWPTLDGTREPCVVDLPDVPRFALARRGARFAVAMRDDAGGLAIAQLDGDGRVLARVAIAPDPPVAGIAMIDAGIVAWRVDQTIALYGDEGQVLARLRADAGQRVLAMSAVPGGALAVLHVTSESGGETDRTRALLATAHGLAWGDGHALPALDPDAPLALSPDGAYLGTCTRGAGAADRCVVVEVATGREVNTGPAEAESSIAFADASRAVMLSRRKWVWLPVDGDKPADATIPPTIVSRALPRIAAAGGIAVSGAFGQLVIATPQRAQYLGYGMPFVAQAVADGSGGIVLAGNERGAGALARVGPDLRATSVQRIPDVRIATAANVGGDDWLVVATRGSAIGLFRWNMQAPTEDPPPMVRPTGNVGLLVFAPATRLVAASGQDAVLLAVDREHGTETLVPTPHDGPPSGETLVPVDPARAGGVRVVRAEQTNDLRLWWMRDERRARKPDVIVPQGQLEAVDLLGRAYVWDPVASHVALYADGQRIAQLASARHLRPWPSPDGQHVLVRDENGVSLETLDGTPVWTSAASSGGRGAWIDGRTLLLVSNAGVLRLDPATGAVLAARCGWDFGLHAQPVLGSSRLEPACSERR